MDNADPQLQSKATARKKKQRIIPPERRKKVAKACDSCKRRKQKCNGLLPCHLCQIKGFQCQYTSIDRRVMKPTRIQMEERHNGGVGNVNFHQHDGINQQKPLQTPYQLSYGSTAPPQPQLNNYQHPQNYHVHGHDEQPLQIAAYPLSKSDYLTPSPIEPAQTLPTKEAESLQNLLTFSVNIHPLDDSDELHNETIASIRDTSRILFDNTGNLCYFGECSPSSYLLQTSKVFQKVLGSTFSLDPSQSTIVENKNFEGKNESDKPYSSPEPIKLSNMLPEKEYAHYLIRTYLNNSNNIVYILNDTDLQSLLGKAYNSPSTVSSRDLCILNFIFAISSIYAKVELSSHIFPFDKSRFIDPGVFYKSAATILTSVATEEISIWLVEAYLLDFFYLQFIGLRNTAWIKLGIAIRYAQSLGLNRKYVNESFKESSHVLHRRKIFRSLYIMDRMSAMYLGRSMTIPEEDWDDLDAFAQINDFQSRLLVISRMNGEVISKIYYNPDLNLKLALGLAVKFQQHSLENPITPENYARPVDHRHFLPDICHLHGVILLARPFFHFVVLHKLGFVNYDTKFKNYVHLRNFYQSCVKSSIMIIKIVEYVYHQNIHPFKPLSLISCTFHAGLVIGLVLLVKLQGIDDDVLSSDDEKKVYKDIGSMMFETLKSAIKILGEYGAIDNAAKRCFSVLKKILKVTMANEQPVTTPDYGVKLSTGQRVNAMGGVVSSIADQPVNNQENYQNILKFKEWMLPVKQEQQRPTQQEEFTRDVASNHFDAQNAPKFLDDLYFNVLDTNGEPPVSTAIPMHTPSPQTDHNSATSSSKPSILTNPHIVVGSHRTDGQIVNAHDAHRLIQHHPFNGFTNNNQNLQFH